MSFRSPGFQSPAQAVPGGREGLGQLRRPQHLELEAHQHHVKDHHVPARRPGAQDARLVAVGLQRPVGRRDALGRLREGHQQPDDGPGRRTRAWRRPARRRRPGPRRAACGAGSAGRAAASARHGRRGRCAGRAGRGPRRPGTSGARCSTRRWGSTVRRVTVPSWARYSKRSSSASRHSPAGSVSTAGSTARGPLSIGTVKALSAPTLRRSRFGSTCSSLASARTEVSPMPSMPCPAAVRSPTATATASSSSSSSGGSSAPAPSWSPPPVSGWRRPGSRARATGRRPGARCAG